MNNITDKDVAEFLHLAGHNLITCGNCGCIMYHKVPYKKDTIRCPYCKQEQAIEHCPDLFYTGSVKRNAL